MDQKLIGARIKERRDEINMSPSELAEATGLNKATIHRYEAGDIKNIKLPVIESIAANLKVNPSWIIGKSTDKFNNDNTIIWKNKDNKEISTIINYVEELLQQDGLMFNGEPADQESLQSLIDAMEIGMQMAQRKNKEKYTTNKNKH